MGSQKRFASHWVIKSINPLSQLLPMCEVHSFPLCRKTKACSTWAPAKSSPRLLSEGENDFIFIHLPGAVSADTGNRALSIWYWLVLIHYPGSFLYSHLHRLSCSRWSPSELQGSPGQRKAPELLPLGYCRSCKVISFSDWSSHSRTTPALQCHIEMATREWLLKQQIVSSAGLCESHLQQGISLFGLAIQWSIRQQFNHYYQCCTEALWRSTKLEWKGTDIISLTQFNRELLHQR